MDGISQGSPFNVDWLARAPGYCRERLQNGASREVPSSRLQSQPSLITTSRNLQSVLYIRRNQSSYPVLSRPVLSQTCSVSYRVVALHLGSLIVMPCSPITRRPGPLGDNAAWSLGGGGGEGKCIHGLTSESGMQHTFISRELLLCQSGIGAGPIDKYPTAPRRCSSLLHDCSSVLWLLWSPVRPAAAARPI